MAGKYLIVFLSLFLVGCAQVGRIFGGPEDRNAPKPIEEKVSPANATTNFSGNEFVIPFDEYFKLSNPNSTIQIVPPHATINASVKKKTLTLFWEESLQPNTTYAIYLNKAIKDLTEGNDSTMQFVFSTGPQIDSLSYSLAAVDAWSQAPEKDAVAILLDMKTDDLVSVAPFTKGVASLNYLHQGTYKLLVLDDKNGDFKPQDNERIGFKGAGDITIDSTYFDSIPVRMFMPEQQPKVKVKSFPPCGFVVTANRAIDSLSNTEFIMFNQKVKAIEYLDGDSVLLFPYDIPKNSGELIVSNPSLTDTISFRFSQADKEKEIKISAINENGVLPSENLQFEVNGLIKSIDKSKIQLMNLKDSTMIESFDVSHELSTFEILLNKDTISNLSVVFLDGAVSSTCGASVKGFTTMNCYSIEDLGELVVDLSGYYETIILDVISNKKTIRSIVIEKPQEGITFSELFPGEYQFKVIRDVNLNGVWDVGNYERVQQPELVDAYSKKVKVRANWTVEVSLSPNE